MCRFHKDVARDAATNPITGQFNIGHEAVVRVALSNFWLERYVKGGETIDGFSPYAMSTSIQRQNFEDPGLARPLPDILKQQTEDIDTIRDAVKTLSQTIDLSVKGLGLPQSYAKDAFLDMAIDEFYQGNPKGDFWLVPSVGDVRLKKLHAAVSSLHANPQIKAVLERLVTSKIAELYTKAPDEANQSIINAYERLPETIKGWARSTSKYGGNIALGGFSGLVGHGVHYASVLGVGLAAGTASALNIGLSAVFMVASYAGWHEVFGGKFRSSKEKMIAGATQVALTLGVAFGSQNLLPHDHMNSEMAQWYESLPPDVQEAYISAEREKIEKLPPHLRKMLEDVAQNQGIPAEVYLLTCSGNDPVTEAINDYLENNPPILQPIQNAQDLSL